MRGEGQRPVDRPRTDQARATALDIPPGYGSQESGDEKSEIAAGYNESKILVSEGIMDYAFGDRAPKKWSLRGNWKRLKGVRRVLARA